MEGRKEGRSPEGRRPLQEALPPAAPAVFLTQVSLLSAAQIKAEIPKGIKKKKVGLEGKKPFTYIPKFC